LVISISVPVSAHSSGYLEKWFFRSNSALCAKILSSKYYFYACGKIFTRALILDENPNFARYPLVTPGNMLLRRCSDIDFRELMHTYLIK